MNLLSLLFGFELFIPIVAVGGFFAALITFIYMYYKTKHVQNMALIETGQDSEMLKSRFNLNWGTGLKTGLLLIGLGLGFILGILLADANGWDSPAGVIPMAMIGGGIGLVVNHLLVSRNNKEID
jgi:hypothetical protein